MKRFSFPFIPKLLPLASKAVKMPADPQNLKNDYKWQANQAKANKTLSLADIEPPYFDKQCHFTLQLYTCGHKTWLNKPRIQHMHPYCKLSPLSSSPTVVDQQSLLAAMAERETTKRGGVHRNHKTRCTNMATKPNEKEMKELCAKCRPVELGVGVSKKSLREYERVVGGEIEGDKEVRKHTEDIGKNAEGNAKFKPGEVKNEVKILATEELPAREVESIPQNPKIQRANSLLGSLFCMIMPAVEPEEGLSDDDEEPLEIWVAVDQDPDWEKVDRKEGKRGLLWKDEGDWVNVNAH